MHYRYPDHYVVGREKIREYATAVKNEDAAFFEEKAAADLGYDGLLAPLTFISVFGYQAQSAFFASADIGIQGEKIAAIGPGLAGTREIEANGKLVMPGGVDSHCHVEQLS